MHHMHGTSVSVILRQSPWGYLRIQTVDVMYGALDIAGVDLVPHLHPRRDALNTLLRQSKIRLSCKRNRGRRVSLMDKVIHDQNIQITYQHDYRGTHVLDTLMVSILFCHCSAEYVFFGGAVDDEEVCISAV